ncbi:iron reductase [Rhodocollybia butyracea]|uniref:ferric-chelate reductase (NADPH) n=1 Tax=Rhodocollybia butyracea TaxID=206335 RepID=A0A9P5Q5G2_9AGAR|nr:iron reductase [Rhodocollybia butyracea]
MKLSPTDPSSVPPNLDKTLRVQRANEYPHEVWFFLTSLIALVVIFRFLSYVSSKLFRPNALIKARDSEKGASHPANRSISLRYLLSALVNFYRIVAFRITLNFGSFSLNLAEVVLTIMYITALFTWTFINTTNVSGGKLDVKYWSDRCGVLVASQLPLITALGTKNSAISFIIGVSHEKLNYLHRMAARVIFVLICVHATGRVSHLGSTWLHCGILAAFSLIILCLISIRPVRARAYEFFFCTHLILVLLILIGSFYHTKNFSYHMYVWPSFVIWGVDRGIRTTRLILFNHLYFGLGSSAGNHTLDANTELITPECVRLTLKRPPHFKWAPGQLAYLICPGVSALPFESHPFTIASYDSREMTPQPALADSSSALSTSTSMNERATVALEHATVSHWKELVFLIHVREGFTKRLAEIAVQRDTIKVYLDGPYGTSHDVSSYKTIVFIAGLSGVSYTLPLLLDTIERVRSGTSICQRATFIWCIRDPAHIQWISDALARALLDIPNSLCISVHIFVTGSSTTPSLDYRSTEDQAGSDESSPVTPVETWKAKPLDIGSELKASSMSLLTQLPAVKVTQGRPSLAKLLQEETDETNGGPMWVTVCGSQSIAGAAREALKFPIGGLSAILRGETSVSLHVESFGYA